MTGDRPSREGQAGSSFPPPRGRGGGQHGENLSLGDLEHRRPSQAGGSRILELGGLGGSRKGERKKRSEIISPKVKG